MRQLVQTSYGDWIQPAAVGFINCSQCTEVTGSDWNVSVISMNGEIIHSVGFKKQEDAEEYREELAVLVNEAIDPLAIND